LLFLSISIDAKMPALLGAKVKSVLSGDTLVLVSPKVTTGEPPERSLALAYVSSPRLNAGDAFGFEAREYLRSMLVGKIIQFKVLYTINGRDYGDIVAPVFSSLLEKAVGDGIVKLRDDASSKESFEEYAGSLEAAQERAKNAQKGVWAAELPSAAIAAPTLPSSVLASKPSKEFPGIIERVISGDRMQLRALIEPSTHFVGTVLIAGIKSPRSGGPDSGAEPFGDTAKLFVSQRLLQRSVRVTFIDLSNTGIPIVSVSHPAGDIAELLLSSGLASVADWQSQYLGAQRMGVLRSAEKNARDSHLNLWKETTGSPAAAKSSKNFEATIARVVSPDTYVIRVKNDEERTVQLASVRAPRKSDPSQEPYVPLAKEFARSRFIGKKANVTVESVRPKSDQFEQRELVSIEIQGKNIALALIETGNATVIRHRKGDEDRSPIWDELLEKETQASAAGVGLHSKKPIAPQRIVDASENVAKAKGFLSSLERQGQIPAVVDYISSGGRLRLLCPRENCILTLVLAGVRVPRPQENFGDVALDYVTKRLWQRDVNFSVNNVDKTGGFIGHVYLPGSKNLPLSVALASEGLAEVHEYSAQQSGFHQQLLEAEEEAQNAKKGRWVDYVPPQEEVAASQPAEPNTGASKQARRYIDILVTDVSSTGQISYRQSSSDPQYKKLAADLTSYNMSAANSTQFTLKSHPKKGDLVIVILGQGQFARARILSFEKPDTFNVELVDSGAVKIVGAASFRALPSQFSLANVPAFAKAAELSFVERPPATYIDDYVVYLEGRIKNKQLVANIDSPSNVSPLSVTLYTADSTGAEDSINGSLIYDGYAFVTPVLPAWARNDAWSGTVAGLKDAEASAKTDRIGVWEYGDPRNLED
jgi:staphylococcal nuclease domain-containing protein 1